MITATRNNPTADCIAMVIVLLMAIGTVFVFSASANVGQELDLHRFYKYRGLRQILFFPLACGVMYFVSCIDYRKLSLTNGWSRNPTVYLLLLSIVLLAIVLLQRFYPVFPRWFVPEKVRFRWINIPLGPIAVSFQPSELAKWSVVFFIAAACARFGDEIKRFFARFIPLCLVVGLVAGLIIVEDFGTAALITLLAFLMLVIAGAKFWHILPPLPVAGFVFYRAIASSPTRINRLLAFWHPEKWTDKINYQPSQSLIALGSGGLWGKGLGRGICKYGHLPEDTTDFIFAIIGEELGFVGNAAVIMLFILFVWLGILVVMRCRDRFGQLLAGGIVLAIAIQAVLNIAVVTVVVPTKGIPLPFVSAGGTSMLLSAAAVGVLLNIAKQNQDPAITDSI
ncbi:MAG: putative peptidoglycan glycosyltransferase FtsW [Planctomycetota bacterium]|nr:putative peptidoglycan glycosyltransferase FtsW [Planctomycetota bacterium]